MDDHRDLELVALNERSVFEEIAKELESMHRKMYGLAPTPGRPYDGPPRNRAERRYAARQARRP